MRLHEWVQVAGGAMHDANGSEVQCIMFRCKRCNSELFRFPESGYSYRTTQLDCDVAIAEQVLLT